MPAVLNDAIWERVCESMCVCVPAAFPVRVFQADSQIKLKAVRYGAQRSARGNAAMNDYPTAFFFTSFSAKPP